MVVIQNRKTRWFWGKDGWGTLANAIRYENKTVCPEMGERVRRLILKCPT
jgi:hypothetical protein